MEIVGCTEERRGEKAAFLGGVFSAHVFLQEFWEGEFHASRDSKESLCRDVALLLRIQ